MLTVEYGEYRLLSRYVPCAGTGLLVRRGCFAEGTKFPDSQHVARARKHHDQYFSINMPIHRLRVIIRQTSICQGCRWLEVGAATLHFFRQTSRHVTSAPWLQERLRASRSEMEKRCHYEKVSAKIIWACAVMSSMIVRDLRS